MTEAGTAEATPARRPTSAGRRPWSIPVRTRIAATIAVMTAVAMSAAGLIVYLLESSRIDSTLNQQIDQEVAELRALQTGDDPRTGEPFASVQRLLRLYLQRNVTDDDEMLVSYINDRPRGSTPNQFGQAILSEAEYQAVYDRLAGEGGTEIFTSPTYEEVWLTVVPVRNRQDQANTGALAIINFADDERGELNRTIRTYALVTLSFLGLITLLATWRAGQLLAPLAVLRTTAETIRETDLSLRVPEQGNDDITALTRTVNGMLSRLEAAFVDQRRFLDDAGHELRTPLTVLQGHLELLDENDPVEVAETRALLLDEVNRMSRLVGDLILLAKHDRPDFLTPAPVSVERLTHTLLAKARGMAERDWHLDAAGEGIAHLDEQRITQAMLQLVDNAVKHTGDDDLIALGSAVSDGRVRLWVRDTGPGVPEPLRDHVFERFGRAENPAGDEGFGLGLSIVRAIARAHGGTVDVTDAEPFGAMFTIRIPQEHPWPAS